MKIRSKVVVIFIILIIVISLIAGIIYKNNSKNKQKKLEENIEVSYQTFELDLENFINIWLLYSEDVKKELNSDKVSNYSNWIKELDEYKKTLDVLIKNSNYLKEHCIKDEYKDSIKTLCKSFITNYETSVNHYVNDIKLFNEFAKNNNLSEYKNTYEYIDLDNDGSFTGKELEVDYGTK